MMPQIFRLPTISEKTSSLSSKLIPPNTEDRTINFGVAIALLPYFYDISDGIKADLAELLKYRNGLFHWKAPEETAFEISKQSFRFIEWIFAFVEKCHSWRDGGDLVHIDPFGDIRTNLAISEKSNR